MDNRPIQVGDLVQIVRWDCCGKLLGQIFKVGEFDTHGPWNAYGCCGALHTSNALAVDDHRNLSSPVEWLKRIPPLEELEGEKTQEDLREPA